jgi:hypothetical protein
MRICNALVGGDSGCVIFMGLPLQIYFVPYILYSLLVRRNLPCPTPRSSLHGPGLRTDYCARQQRME